MNLSPPIGQVIVKEITWPNRGLAEKNSSFGPWSRSAQLVQLRVINCVESPCRQTGTAGTAAVIMDGTIWERRLPGHSAHFTGWDSVRTSRPMNCSPPWSKRSNPRSPTPEYRQKMRKAPSATPSARTTSHSATKVATQSPREPPANPSGPQLVPVTPSDSPQNHWVTARHNWPPR